jgi:hypothetical protein
VSPGEREREKREREEREREERERGGRRGVGDGTTVAVSALFDA